MKKNDPKRNNAVTSYTADEEQFVTDVAKLATQTGQTMLAIGKLVAELVAKAGGTKYGNRTLERISKHPKLRCTLQYLYRCWGYFQLHTVHGAELTEQYPGLCQTAWAELARLLHADIRPTDGLTAEETKKQAIFECAMDASKKAMNAHQVREMVTDYEERFAPARKSSRKTGGKKGARAKSKLARPRDTAGALTTAAATIVQVTKPKVLEKAKLSLADTRKDVERVLDGVRALLENLVERGPDDVFAATLTTKLQSMLEVATKFRQPAPVPAAA